MTSKLNSSCIKWIPKLGKDFGDELFEAFSVLLWMNSWDLSSCLQNTQTHSRSEISRSSPLHFAEHWSLTPCLTALAAWAAFFLVSYCVSTSIRPIKYTSLRGAPTRERFTVFGERYWSAHMILSCAAQCERKFRWVKKRRAPVSAVGTHPQRSE